MRFIFGDNQYQGVSHVHGRGRDYGVAFQDVTAVSNHLHAASELGVSEFAFTASNKVVNAIGQLPSKSGGLILHPSIPYAHDVNEKISERGLAGAVAHELLSSIGPLSLLTFLRAALLLPIRPYQAIWELLLAHQLDKVPRAQLGSVGLLNVAFDLLLGLKRLDIIVAFDRAVRALYGVDVWFYTMNAARASDALISANLQNVTIVTNINTAGFRMNPTKRDVLDRCKPPYPNPIIGMSIFSGTGIDPSLFVPHELPNLTGLLIGGNDLDRVSENIQTVKDLS
jgi:hypothetical protein